MLGRQRRSENSTFSLVMDVSSWLFCWFQLLDRDPAFENSSKFKPFKKLSVVSKIGQLKLNPNQ